MICKSLPAFVHHLFFSCPKLLYQRYRQVSHFFC
uniref:Uncharacterized protein n=1 Tax=Arundo donax TaxID=35708 RepID=A0A0A9HAM1_ARUDO